MNRQRTRSIAAVLASALLAGGCAVHPEGEKEERDRAIEAGRAYEERTPPPPLPETPSVDDYLRTAFLSNADLEMRYWEWRAALERIPQEASPPNAAVSFSYLFSGGNLKSWDRTTLGISNDPEVNLPFPTKLGVRGRRALEEARAAGLRFEAAKFRLQAEVLSAYYDLALHAEQLRLEEERASLLDLLAERAAARAGTGGATTRDLLAAATERDLARDGLRSLHGQLPTLAARMNALLGRAVDAPVPLPAELPEPRPFSERDDEIVKLAAERSPELEALARDVAGRAEALELARQEYIPDVNLAFSFTGSVSQTIGAVFVLPTRLEAIRAGIAEAEASLRAAQAARAQYERDLGASFVLDLYVLRNAEREAALLEETIVPRAQRAVELAQTSVGTGRSSVAEWAEAGRTFVDARLSLARVRMEREKALAAIETWSALDVEALHPVSMAAR